MAEGRWDDGPARGSGAMTLPRNQCSTRHARSNEKSFVGFEERQQLYDYGFLAAYQDGLDVPRSRSHATKKTPAQLDAEIADILAGPLLNPATSGGVVTRNYEYIVYPEASHRHAERAVKVPQRRGRGPYDLGDAKLVAKKMGAPAAIYSTSKGRFVGYVHPSGRYVTFR